MTPLDRLNDGLGEPGNVIDKLGGTPALIAALAAIAWFLLGGDR